MPLFSAFTPLGHYRLSAAKPIAQTIFETLVAGQGDLFDESFDSRQSARLYAQAMCLGSAHLQLERAGNNRKPNKAIELLSQLEKDYQVTPSYNASIQDRQAVLTARSKTSRGARRESVEDALRSLLGDDFVRYETIDAADLVTWPASPGSVGVFAAAGAEKKVFSLDAAVSLTGTPLSVRITLIGNSNPPIPGETYCVDPDSRGSPEQITISQVLLSGARIVATFTRAHEAGTIATRPHPMWISNQRCNLIVVTETAAMDPETRRKLNEQMERMLRGVSRWGITTDLGVLTPDDATLGHPWLALPE